MEFLGQGCGPSCNCDWSHSCSNTRSLPHCTGLGIEPMSLCSQDAADPIVPQQELPSCHLILLFIVLMTRLVLFCFLWVVFFFFFSPEPWYWSGMICPSVNKAVGGMQFFETSLTRGGESSAWPESVTDRRYKEKRVKQKHVWSVWIPISCKG